MGSFMVNDGVTGLAIDRDEDVVGIVIQRRTGGYPDALTALAVGPLGPTDLFEPASLPIFGKMGDMGEIVPEQGQISAAIFSAMVGKEKFEDALAFATDFRDGGMAYPIDRISALMGQAEPVKEILGLAVFTRSTWDKVVSMRWARCERDEDVDTVMAIADDLARRSADKDDWATVQLISLRDLRLGRGRPYTFSDGRQVEVPIVASALESQEGGSPASSDFARWLTSAGPLGKQSRDKPNREIVEGLWELVAFEQGLDVIGRTLGPAKKHGQHVNHLDTIDAGLLAIENAGAQIIARAEDDRELRDSEVERLQAQLASMDEIRERLEMALTKAAPRP